MSETTTTKTATKSFATLLGCDPKSAARRIAFLGLSVTCNRCHGSGRYSYNAFDGDRCYGCNGACKVMPKYTTKLAARVTEMVAAGALEPYFAKVAAIRAAKAQIAPLVAEARAIYEEIGEAYELGYKWSWDGEPSELTNSPLGHAQTMNNSLFWGNSGRAYYEQTSVCRVESLAKDGRMPADVAVAKLTELVGLLTELRAAWRAL